jgi:hypothetical protein
MDCPPIRLGSTAAVFAVAAALVGAPAASSSPLRVAGHVGPTNQGGLTSTSRPKPRPPHASPQKPWRNTRRAHRNPHH